MRLTAIACCLLTFSTLVGCSGKPDARAGGRPGVVRVAVIGGMTMTGLWERVSRMFEADTGLKVEVVATGPRPVLDLAMRQGGVDLLTMHSGDITTDLVADGYGRRMRPWTRNDLVIVGPVDDPAKVRGLTDGAEAFRRIAAAEAPFIDFSGIGSREMCHKLWKQAGISPAGAWYLQDEGVEHTRILDLAVKRHAYVVVGRMPVLYEKLKGQEMEILVQGDPQMRRPYVVMEADPAKAGEVNVEGARKLADYLLSEKVQRFLAEDSANRRDGMPLFYPVAAGQ
ncbi:MAG: Tungstate-binding protein TupA [Phycisphaerae bacterium]|nr:Tungstate-binding protein TupA [Phycisphaerae bacterium]